MVEVDSNPMVSVVIPSYNHRSYIQKCLDSVLEQSYRNFEIVIVDDGSTDGSAEFLKEFTSNFDVPVHLILQANQGAHAALNLGIEKAKGEYISILNSDDFYQFDRVEKLLRYCQEKDAKIVFSRVNHIDDTGGVALQGNYRQSYFRHLELAASFGISFVLLGYNLAITSGNLFFHRKSLSPIKFEKYRTVHDWDFVLKAMCLYPVHCYNEALMCYRIHANNTISRGHDDSEDCRQLQSAYFAQAMKKGLPTHVPNSYNFPVYFEWFTSTIFPGVASMALENRESGTYIQESVSPSDMERSLAAFSQIRPEWFKA